MKKKTTTFFILVFALFSFSVMAASEKDVQELPISVDFELFNGVNLHEVYPGWNQGKGIAPTPQIMNSAWYRGDVLYGTATATVTFDNIGLKDEWIISPQFEATQTTKVTFMAALSRIWNDPHQGNFSHNDSVNVMVATSGYDFTETVYTFKQENQPDWQIDHFEADLSDFAGQTIRIAFYATNGQEANSLGAFHIDDIMIKDATPKDAMAFDLAHPTTTSCFVADIPVVARIKNDGIEPISSVPVRARIRGAVTQNLFGSYEGVIEPGEFAEVEVGVIENPPYGEYKFTLETELPGDEFEYNTSVSDIVRENPEPLELPLPKMNFIGFYSDNLGDVYPGWYEARGRTWPRVAMNTDWQGTNYDDARTASVYFTQLGTEDWMVGPKFTASENLVVELRAGIEFDTGYDQMGSDDRLSIMVSPDCGETWQEAGSFTQETGVTANLQPYSFPVDGYDGQEIILAFYASTGEVNDPESYIFHITDVKIRNQYAYDAGVTRLLAPGNSCSFTDQEEVIVRVENFGTESISDFEVAYHLEGEDPVVETITQSLETGETLDYVFGQTLDLTWDTQFSLSVYTLLENDENPDNDGLYDVTIRLSSFDLTTEGSYWMSFEEDEDYDEWQVEDANEDGITWERVQDAQHANTGEYSYAYFSNQSSEPSNDWLFSPCFNLEAGETYYVSFYYKNRATNWPESLRLKLGNAPTGDAMDIELIDLGEISNPPYQKAEVTFTVDESGEYYFGWHAYGPADQFGMHIDDITIYQVFEYDLALTNHVRPRQKDADCGLEPATSMNVEVSNPGMEDINSFSVYLQLNDEDAVNFDINETIEAGESLWITLENGFAIPDDEMVDITIWVDHPQDDNAANDTIFIPDYLMTQFHTSFEGYEDLEDWTSLSLAGTNEWEQMENPSVARTGDYVYAMRTDGAGGNTANDDWLFSECFYLEEGTCYEISFYYRSHFSTENLAVHLGSGQDPDDMSELLIDLPEFNTNEYVKASKQFTVDESGVYHFGWHTDGGTTGRYYIYLDDLAVVQDLEATPFADPEYLVLDHEVAFMANAENVSSFLWEFGDGNFSEQENPFHIYDAPGTYDVNLTVGSGCLDEVYSFELELELPLYQVNFDVTDHAGNPIDGAVVEVDGQVNDPGDYIFELLQGGYPFAVTKEDYLDVSGNFTVIDDDLVVLVQMPYEGDTFTVTFVVLDEEGNEITGAEITFNETTYDPGVYVIEDVVPGTYDYLVTKEDYLTEEGQVEVVDEDVTVEVVLLVTGIDTPLSESLKVYPNPATDQVSVTFDGKVSAIRILNLSGQVMHRQEITDQGDIRIGISGLKAGTYILQVESEGETFPAVLIKK